MKTITKLILTSIVSLSFLLLIGCNTVSGFGKDVQKGGKALTKAADK